MIRYTLTSLLVTLIGLSFAGAQMVENGDTLLGNEWINYGQEYYKIKIGQDGIYRFTSQQLGAEGIPVAQINPATLRLYWMGREQQLFVSTLESTLGDTDFIEFYAQKNRSELDRFLFQNPDETMLNPGYGLTADSSSYYLTWTPGESSSIRYESIVTNLGGVIPQKRIWYSHKEHLELNTHHHKGKINNQGVRFSQYVEGEGFGSKADAKHSVDIEVKSLASEGPRPTLHFRMTGNLVRHEVNLAWNSISKMDLQFEGTNNHGGSILIKDQFAIDRTELTAENTFEASTSGPTDKVTFGQIYLEYPRHLDFDGKDIGTVTFEDARDGMYLELSNFNHGNIAPIVFDLNGGNRITSVVENDLVKIIVPSGPSNRRLVIVNPQSQIKSDHKIERIAFDPLHQSDAQFIMISHRALLQAGNGGGNHVEAYAEYRQSEAGGSYRTQIIDISQLEDQFAYGVDLHPLSVKNFLNYISEQWSDPQFIFLIGKGLEYAEGRHQDFEYNYLPVFGIPGSDNLLTSKMESSVPLVPVGRLAARTPEHIAIYLDKIRTMEDLIANAPQTIEDRAWMKRVLHLSAGSGASEQNIILKKMNSMATLVEGDPFAGTVYTVKKESNDVIEGSVTKQVLDLLNDGVLLKTYFGHGAITTTEFQGFEDPFFLDNKDRYPVMLALGCLTGNVFTEVVSLSENNVLTTDKGATLYMATSGLGFLTALDQFASVWYTYLLDELRGQPIGVSIQKTLAKFDDIGAASQKTLNQQFIVHGDPAYSLARLEYPDFVIDPNSITTSPQNVSIDLETFSLSFDMLNLGSSPEDSMYVKVIQETPSGIEEEHGPSKISIGGYQTTVIFDVPLVHRETGTHKFDIAIDSENNIEEDPKPIAEENNFLSESGTLFDVFISTSSIKAMYPAEYGIVYSDPVEVMAFNSSSSNTVQNILFEIDTVLDFNSPFLFSESVTTNKRIASWKPAIGFENEKVYYWRVRLAEQSDSSITYSHSSFTYLTNSSGGWNQGHYQQYQDDELTSIQIDTIDRGLSYGTKYIDLTLKNKIWDPSDKPRGQVDGVLWKDFFTWEYDQGITIVVSDPSDPSGFSQNPRPGLHGSKQTIFSSIAAYPFSLATTEERMKIINFIDNVIPDDKLVLLYTCQGGPDLSDLSVIDWQNDSITNNGKNLYNTLEQYGAKEIRGIENNPRPYIFSFVKNGSYYLEDLAENESDIISQKLPFPVFANTGTLVTVPIGPALEWSDFSMEAELESGDSIEVSVIGIDNNGEEILLSELKDMSADLSSIDPHIYPYLKINLDINDDQSKTLPYIQYIRVNYEKPPEFVVDFTRELPFITHNVSDDKLDINYSIHNIGPIKSDSIRTTLFIDQAIDTLVSNLHIPLDAGAFQEITESLVSSDQKGTITLEVNPKPSQLEQFHYNNFLSDRFDKKADKINPVLDITFDGKRIMQSDIVSPAPEIVITLTDENPSKLIEDPELFEVYIVDPNGDRIRYSDGDPNVQFIPAGKSDDAATFRLNPQFEIPGTYNLVVQGSDVSGNLSGDSNAEIEFEVILTPSISNIINYPNPFSEKTRFAYVLTGSQIPEHYMIQIYTPAGQVVRELTEADLGPLYTGRNITVGSWDGTDQYGDRLANGTYLYSFKIDKQESFEHFESAVDDFFFKHMGKMVLLK